ncbi:hypothetical protein M422DRAFT_266496 [Sphaerobolus stellatus SS14]|uniref:Uncharacterized protein n=1 Tax=Sphaerobolus stellatus (strain SS14) TaxID=990650 RepID=A0A0C9V2I1_SPHS4|nr:hypothetical protein M422DRAFT_266496 [Sphaerobolus stellatus SS14]
MNAEAIQVGDKERIKVGVCAMMSRSEDLEFVQILAAKIHHAMTVSSSYLFAIFPTMLRIGGTTIWLFVEHPNYSSSKPQFLRDFGSRLAWPSFTTWNGHELAA